MNTTFSKTQLTTLSKNLLVLHKALVTFQQKEYEGKFGKIKSPTQLLDLLINNTSFMWLRELSTLIIGIDELVDSKEDLNEKQVSDLVDYAKSLLLGTKEKNEFSEKYLSALHRDPHAALTHGKITQLLKSL